MGGEAGLKVIHLLSDAGGLSEAGYRLGHTATGSGTSSLGATSRATARALTVRMCGVVRPLSSRAMVTRPTPEVCASWSCVMKRASRNDRSRSPTCCEPPSGGDALDI
jgi:hypothetical protein